MVSQLQILFIFLRVDFDKEDFLRDVKEKFEEQNQVFIVVSEGLKTKDGKFLSEIDYISQDNFCHAQLGGVCHYLKDLIIEAGITQRVKSIELGILQRCAMHCASQTDIDEAFQVGYEALKFASSENNGFMVSIQRDGNSPYKVSYTLVEAD